MFQGVLIYGPEYLTIQENILSCPVAAKRRNTNILSGLLPCNVPSIALKTNCPIGGTIETTQIHAPEYASSHQGDLEHHMVLPAAAMDEDPGDGNVDMLATSTRARQAVKRYLELDDQPTFKKTKKMWLIPIDFLFLS